MKEAKSQREKLLQITLQERSEEWEKEKALMIAENDQKDEEVRELVLKHEGIIKQMKEKHSYEMNDLIKRHDYALCEH